MTAGTVIAQLDTQDAQKAVRDAEVNLEAAEISLAQAKEETVNNLEKAYEDGFNAVVEAFLDFPVVMSGLNDILFSTVVSTNTIFSYGTANLDIYMYYTEFGIEPKPIYDSIYYKSCQAAKSLYEKNLADYKSVSRFSDKNTIESLIEETYQTAETFSEAIKNTNNLVSRYKETLKSQGLTINPAIDTYISDLNTYTNKTNTHLANIFSIKNTIVANSEADPSDIRSKELSVEQKENALSDAKEKLADYSIRVPSDGVIAQINVKKGDSVSSATILTTLISYQKIAEISLNEIDVAKVRVGQKATLTFDALPELSISGKVIEVDTVGTATQGVVSYGVKIDFDSQDERIKPGMSVTADIITDAKQDVLLLPNSAIKSQGNSYYVELVEVPEEMRQQLLTNGSGIILPKPPQQQQVEIGLSNDLSAEIVSGLKEGDIVITSTISSNKVQTTQTQTDQSRRSQEFRIPGL